MKEILLLIAIAGTVLTTGGCNPTKTAHPAMVATQTPHITPTDAPEPPRPTSTPPPTLPALTTEPPASESKIPDGPISSTPNDAPLPASQGTGLTGLMDRLPLGFAQRGVWFSNFEEAFRAEGIPMPLSAADLAAFTPEQGERFNLALRGLPSSSLVRAMKQKHHDWEQTFGFDHFQVRQVAVTGELLWASFETNLLFGEFDPGRVTERLTVLMYEPLTLLGETYHVLPGDATLNFPPSMRSLARSEAQAVWAMENRLVASTDVDVLKEFLRLEAGEALPLSHAPAFADLAQLMGDPLAAVLMSRASALTPESERGMEPWTTPDDWGDIGEWEVLGLAYNRSSESRRISIYLWYPESADAEPAAAELRQRVGSYSLPGPNPLMIMQDLCDGAWSTEADGTPQGAVATLSCELPASMTGMAVGLGDLHLNLLEFGILEVLLR